MLINKKTVLDLDLDQDPDLDLDLDQDPDRRGGTQGVAPVGDHSLG